jgi:hypothetical protein
MRRAVISFVIAMAATGAAHAALVAVVDPDGKPVARATALCVDPASADPLVVADGKVTLADSCRRVRCDATGFLPGEVAPSGPDGRCVLRPASNVVGELPVAAAASGLEASLAAAGNANTSAAKIAIPKAGEGRRSATFALPPVKPGRYTLQLRRGSDGWSCRADLGPLGPGTSRVAPAWREPVSLPLKVILPDGKPAPGIGVRAWSRRPLEDGVDEPASPFGTWNCRSEAPATVTTDRNGLARVGVDLAQETLVVAGDFKNARGLAYVTLDRAPAEPVTMTLSLPVIVKAKIEDDHERPAVCDVTLDDLAPDVRWIARVAGGSTLKSICDPQGGVLLGPIPSIPFTLDVLPKPGLPLRVTAEAPAPGTTADLGVLRVRNGERFRVVVQDEMSNPVSGAKVIVRGAAGVVLSVGGITGDDGGADLMGLPKNASVTVEVKAKGFLPVSRRQLPLDASPFVIKLSRGGAIEGAVRDRDGAAIRGAVVGLWGETAGRDPVTTDAHGAFSFEGVPDGTWRLSARASGYTPSEPHSLEVHEHRSVEDVTIELSAAEGISGKVVDAAGTSVAGAQVRLYISGQRDSLNQSPPLAEAVSGSDGAFELQAGREAHGWIVATKPGFGPRVVRGSDLPANEDAVLALTEPASLIVHVARGARTTRAIGVTDGAGLRRSTPATAGTDLSFGDLGPGNGSVQLGEGPGKAVTLIARQTAEVTLEATAAIEGRVTFENAPSPRTFVSAVRQREGGGLSGRDGSFTDDRGRYRIDGMDAGSYRLVAVGEDGRAETTLELAEAETSRIDLALRSVRLVLSATDSADDKPIADLSLSAAPAGKTCNSMIGSTSWNEPGQMGFDISVGSNGCVSGRTDAAGVARLSLAAPGSYDLILGDDRYETWSQAIAVGDGTTSKRVALTRKPDKSGEKTHLYANLLTNPPGLLGRVECRCVQGREGCHGRSTRHHRHPVGADVADRFDLHPRRQFQFHFQPAQSRCAGSNREKPGK